MYREGKTIPKACKSAKSKNQRGEEAEEEEEEGKRGTRLEYAKAKLTLSCHREAPRTSII